MKTKTITQLFAIVGLIALNLSTGQTQTSYREFTVKELKADFKQFRETLEGSHCCLYEYTDKNSFDELFKHQYSLIKKPMGLSEFFKTLTPIIAKVGCGHTHVWMPMTYWQIYPYNLFPLTLRIINDTVVVTGTYNDSLQIPYGSIITSINGRDINEIITEMRLNMYSDAFNKNFIDAQIQRRFSMIYARRFGFPEKYEVTYTLPGRTTNKTCELMPASLEAVRAVVFKNFRDPELNFEIDQEKNMAIMTINSFIYYDAVDFFKAFIDSCFSIINEKKIKNLVLDLRGNDGGDPFCAVPLFSYLEHEPVPYFAERYGKYSDFADPVPLAENPFKGNLYTFIDGRCFSTNGHFSSLLKYHKIGKLIGTEAGSSYCCNAGKNGNITLDNTGIMLYFGRSSFAVAVKDMDKSIPIQPDYFINETYRDFLEGGDLYMEMVYKLINN